MRLHRIVFLLLFGVACGALSGTPAEAVDAPQNAQTGFGLEQLMAAFGQIKSAEARFMERKYLSLLNAPLESSGTLVYVAPDRLEKRTLLPKPESFVIDRGELTIEGVPGQRRRTMRIQNYPELAAFVESIRATLAGDVQTLRRFYDVRLEGSADDWKLILRPTAQRMQRAIKNITLGGSNAKLHTVEIEEADGDRSVMTVVTDSP